MGILYENTLLGGSTMAGASPTFNGNGTYAFSISMPGALLITKAYLGAGRCGTAANLTVTLNNGFSSQNFTFDSTNQVSAPFVTSYQNGSGLSGFHAIDITSFIPLTATVFLLTVPPQLFPSVQRYSDFVLCVEWLSGAGKTTTQWYINENNIGSNNQRTLNFADPIDNTKDVGMALFTGYICNNTTSGNGSHDAENILINSTNIGHIGSTTGDGFCGGSGYLNVIGNYSYALSTLTAGANCNANQAVSGLDALSNIQALIALNDTSYVLDFNAVDAGNTTNNLWLVATSYVNTTPTYETVFCQYISPTISGITSSGATVNWCAQGGIVNFQNEVQWRLGGTTVWTGSGTLTNVSTYNITGLLSNTIYEFRIRGVDYDGTLSIQPSAIQRFKTQ